MVSHKKVGSTEFSVSVDGGMRFKKKAGAGQRCIGAHMKGNKYATLPEGMGGRHNVEVQKDFYDAAKACGFKVEKPRPGSGK